MNEPSAITVTVTNLQGPIARPNICRSGMYLGVVTPGPDNGT